MACLARDWVDEMVVVHWWWRQFLYAVQGRTFDDQHQIERYTSPMKRRDLVRNRALFAVCDKGKTLCCFTIVDMAFEFHPRGKGPNLPVALELCCIDALKPERGLTRKRQQRRKQ